MWVDVDLTLEKLYRVNWCWCPLCYNCLLFFLNSQSRWRNRLILWQIVSLILRNVGAGWRFSGRIPVSRAKSNTLKCKRCSGGCNLEMHIHFSIKNRKFWWCIHDSRLKKNNPENPIGGFTANFFWAWQIVHQNIRARAITRVLG